MNGALQFDKDIRMLNQCFSKQCSVEKIPKVREILCRLSHFSVLLNVDSLEEVEEIWRDHITRSTVKLSLNEVKSILMLRIDIDEESIQGYFK